MSGKRYTELEMKKIIHDAVHGVLDLEFIKDKEQAMRDLTKTMHTILRREGHNLFYDDLLNYVEKQKDTKVVY